MEMEARKVQTDKEDPVPVEESTGHTQTGLFFNWTRYLGRYGFVGD